MASQCLSPSNLYCKVAFLISKAKKILKYLVLAQKVHCKQAFIGKTPALKVRLHEVAKKLQ